jgi:hypothetical protein
LIAVAAVVAYSIGVFGFGWPRWPEVLNSDLEVVGLTYLVSAVVGSTSLFWWLQARRAGDRIGTAGLLGSAVVAVSVAMLSSAAMVYLE